MAGCVRGIFVSVRCATDVWVYLRRTESPGGTDLRVGVGGAFGHVVVFKVILTQQTQLEPSLNV